MMLLLADSATLAFSPAAPWSWDGWNGELEIAPNPNGAIAAGASVGVKSDLIGLGLKLMGKKYKAPVFDDIPGVVVSASIIVKEPTLSEIVAVNGIKVAHAKTEGTFILNCIPAISTKQPSPIPDPVPVKSGTWKIKSAGQTLVEVD